MFFVGAYGAVEIFENCNKEKDNNCNDNRYESYDIPIAIVAISWGPNRVPIWEYDEIIHHVWTYNHLNHLYV